MQFQHFVALLLKEKGYTVVTVYEELDPRNMLHDPMLLHIIVIDEKLSPADGHVILIAVFYDKVCTQPNCHILN